MKRVPSDFVSLAAAADMVRRACEKDRAPCRHSFSIAPQVWVFVLALSMSGPAAEAASVGTTRGMTPRLVRAAPGDTVSQASLRSRYRLLRRDGGWVLRVIGSGRSRTLRVPRPWLVPTELKKDWKDASVSPFAYAEQVEAFPVDRGRVGLHLSSYAVQERGSAAAAAGRDVFVLLDRRAWELHPAGPELGISKSRIRRMGCFSARAHRFLVGDIDNDGRTDLAVIETEVRCDPERSHEGEGPHITYREGPVRWHVFTAGRWQLDRSYNRRLPRGYRELSLIGLEKSPVEFVLEILSR